MESNRAEKNAGTSLPSIFSSGMQEKRDLSRESMRSKLNSDKYSDEAKSAVKQLVDEAVNFLLNREARSLPKAAKVRYLLNVRRYPPKLLKYPDIADALDLPVLEKPPETPPTILPDKLDTIQGSFLSLCVCQYWCVCVRARFTSQV